MGNFPTKSLELLHIKYICSKWIFMKATTFHCIREKNEHRTKLFIEHLLARPIFPFCIVLICKENEKARTRRL